MSVMFLFFQSLGPSLDCHDFSNMMESDLATASVLPVHKDSLDEKGHLSVQLYKIPCAKDEELMSHLVVI